jgi:hypothetical protein
MPSRLVRLAPFFIGTILFAYVAFRAYFLSFTHDEGFTCQHFLYPSLKEIFLYSNPVPNNHLLNTLCIRFLFSILPLDDFTERLPNVLLYLVYLAFSWRITRDIRSAGWRVAAFVFLNSVPYLLDFFSMARGYGMSFAFIMGSLYYLKSWLQESKTKSLVATLLFGALATLASFVVLNFYLSLCGVIFIAAIANNRDAFWRKSWKTFLVLLGISAPLIGYVSYVSLKMQSDGQLWAGTDSGFWNGTVKSLITRILYREFPVQGLPFVLMSGVIVLILGAAIWYSYRALKINQYRFNFLAALTLVVLSISASLVLQHYLLGVLYVQDRTALFILIPFLVLTVELFREKVQFQWGKIAFGILVGGSLLNLLVNANFSYFLEAKFDANTKEALYDLKAYRQGKDLSELKGLYVYWYYHPASCFYQASENIGALKQIERYGTFDPSYEYYYIPDSLLYNLRGKPIKVIKRYSEAQTVLLENLTPQQKKIYAQRSLSLTQLKKPIVKVDGRSAFTLDSAQFGPELEFDATILPHDRLMQAEVTMEVWCTKKAGGDIVVQVSEENGNTVLWASKPLAQTSLTPNKWMPVSFIQNLPRLEPDKKYTIKVYFWNTGKHPVSIARQEAIITDQANYGI